MLPTWLFRETMRNPIHSFVSVFVGPDADHLARVGQLVFSHDQAEDLFAQCVGGPLSPSKRFIIERYEGGTDADQ